MQRAKRLLVAIMICVLAALSVALVACNNVENHTYKWEFSETEHWRVCTDEGCGEEDGTRAAHTLVGDRCACGYVKETIETPEHIHDFTGAWVKVNDTYHARKCASADCDDKSAYDTDETSWQAHIYPTEGDNIYVCSECGFDNTPDHIHDFTGGQLEDLGDGTHGIKCADSECPDEAVYDESIEYHVFDIVADDEDGENHHYECECGAVDEDSHDDHYYIIVIDDDGIQHHNECDDCGYILPGSQGEHVYSIVAFGPETHWMECECGAKQDGSEETHVYKFADATEDEDGSVYYTDSANHWKQCECGAKEEAAHVYEEWEVAVASTCLAYGYEESDCEICGYVGNRDLTELDPTNHAYAAPTSADSKLHYYVPICEHEDAEPYYEGHDYIDDGLACAECDYRVIVRGTADGFTYSGNEYTVFPDQELVIVPNYINGVEMTTIKGGTMFMHNYPLMSSENVRIVVIPSTIKQITGKYVFSSPNNNITASPDEYGMFYEGDYDTFATLYLNADVGGNDGRFTNNSYLRWDYVLHFYSETPAEVTYKIAIGNVTRRSWHWVNDGDPLNPADWKPALWTREEIDAYASSASEINLLDSLQNFVALAR